MHAVKITSTGLYLPPKVQTSEELSGLIGKSEKWIKSRTGVSQRRIAEEPMNEMAAKAARMALGDGPPPDCIINASTTPLQLIPDSSVFIQETLGFKSIPSWSMHATCLSFVVALINAAALIESKLYKRILIVSAETGTPFRNMKQAESAALFGDGAAAAIVEPAPKGKESGIIDWNMSTWPDGAKLTEFRGAGTRLPPDGPDTRPEDNLFSMQGPKVYRMARDKVKENLTGLFHRNQITADNIDWLIPHQASGPALASATRYGFDERKVINIVSEYGNCIAASIPMALAHARQNDLLNRGDLLLIGGTGAGLSVAFLLMKW